MVLRFEEEVYTFSAETLATICKIDYLVFMKGRQSVLQLTLITYLLARGIKLFLSRFYIKAKAESVGSISVAVLQYGWSNSLLLLKP